MADQDVVQSVFNGFYRNPDPQAYILAVRHVDALGDRAAVELQYIVARIALVYEDCRTALMSLESEDENLTALARGLASPKMAELLPQPLEMPLDHPQVMDLIWGEFAVTGNTEAVHRIVSVLDFEDLVRKKLSAWLAEQLSDGTSGAELAAYRDRFIAWELPIDHGTGTIGGAVDLDLHVLQLGTKGKFKFTDLPFDFSQDEYLAMGMKSAAVWSLRSVASFDPAVAAICAEAAIAQGGAGRKLLVG